MCSRSLIVALAACLPIGCTTATVSCTCTPPGQKPIPIEGNGVAFGIGGGAPNNACSHAIEDAQQKCQNLSGTLGGCSCETVPPSDVVDESDNHGLKPIPDPDLPKREKRR